MIPGCQSAAGWPSSQAATSVEPRDLGTGIAVELVVGLQLRQPAGDLAFEEPVGRAEVAEPDGVVVDRAERGDAVGRLQAHRWRDARIARRVRLGEADVGLNPSIGSIR